MLPQFSYVKARTTEEAIEWLARPGSRLHAGGTDLLGCLRDGVFDAEIVVSITAVDGLRGIESLEEGGLRIGALTRIRDIAVSDAVRSAYPALAQAAAEVASPQLRNQGTLGGNLCQRPRCWYFRGEFDCAKKGGDSCFAFDGENRYHAILGGGPCFIVHPSDTAPALVALGATVRLAGPDGEREMPLEEFFVLPERDLHGETVLRPGELLTEVRLPAAESATRSVFRKVRERGAWDFALASVALALQVDDGSVRSAGVVLGGVAPVPWRASASERVITGKRLELGIIERAARAAVSDATPLEHNGYKVPLVRGVVEEGLLDLAR
jgi:xanthine dehydrogenase YagS FAD-binding subunit